GELALAGRKPLWLGDEPLEDHENDVARVPVLRLDVRSEIDAVEHEAAQREHRLADLVALHDVSLALRALDDVVDEGVDPCAPCRPEERDLLPRQVVLAEDAV